MTHNSKYIKIIGNGVKIQTRNKTRIRVSSMLKYFEIPEQTPARLDFLVLKSFFILLFKKKGGQGLLGYPLRVHFRSSLQATTIV